MTIKSILKLMRINQWTKNVLVLAPVFFSGNILNFTMIKTALFIFITFCLASSSVYVLNDIFDYKTDKLHPTKKNRPIASQKISINFAYGLYLILFLSSLYLSLKIATFLFYVVLVYLLINIAYSKYLKYVVILDVLVVAFGYVLRVLAGVLPLGIFLSPWILGSTLTLTLMITLAKRYAELVNHDKSEQRVILQQYDKDFLQALLVLTAGLTITIYLLWCIEDPIGINKNILIFSSMFVFYGVLRYLYLTIKFKSTEDPSKLLFKDVPLVVNGLLWIAYMVVLIYVK